MPLIQDKLRASVLDVKGASGTDLCRAMGFPISSLHAPTLALDHDCFNGRSSVGVKYTRLDIDYKLVNERDFPDDPEDDEPDIHPLDWDYIDEDGEDVFDRVGFLVFGGSGWVAGFYRNIIGPGLSTSRRVYRSYLSEILYYILSAIGALLLLEMFARRKIHRTHCLFRCCFRQKAVQINQESGDGIGADTDNLSQAERAAMEEQLQ